MFEYIKGKVVEVGETILILELHNIAYRLHIFESNYFSPYLSSDEEVQVYIYEHINEQEHLWFGFSKRLFRDFFLCLISVSGVGPKSAIKMLNQISPLEMMELVASKNTLALKNIKGVGEKTISRIVIEIAGKVEKILLENKVDFSSSWERDGLEGIGEDSSLAGSVRGALLNLGYKENEIRKSIEQIKKENDPEVLNDLELFLKECLKILVK